MTARLPIPGSDDGTWGQILNDFLSQVHNSDGTLKDIPQSKIQNLTADLAARAKTTDLAPVATSGKYDDLTNKPTVPDPSNLVSNTDLDTKTAALVDDGGSNTSVSLRAAYAPITAAKIGGRVAYLGDSITQSAWQNSTNFQGGSFPLFAMMAAGGQLVTVANAGLSGDTSAQMLARFDTDVTPSAPNTVVVLAGTNDVGQGVVTLSGFAANIRAIVAKIRGIGAVPVLATIPCNNDPTRHLKISAWNSWLRQYAGQQGISFLNFYGLLADPANGNYLSTYLTDGTHPNTAGYVAMGSLVSSTLTPIAPRWRPHMSQDNTDQLNALTATNSIALTDSNADGVADGWFAYGGASGFAHALVTDSQVAGKMMQITQTGNAANRILEKSVTAAVGDRLAVSGLLTSDGGVNAAVKLSFTGPGSNAQAVSYSGAGITRGFFYQEVVVPASTTGVLLDLIAGPGTGVVSWGQVTVVNLTSTGIFTA